MMSFSAQAPICSLLPGADLQRRKSSSLEDSFDESDFEMHSFHEFKEKIFNQDSKDKAQSQKGKYDQMADAAQQN